MAFEQFTPGYRANLETNDSLAALFRYAPNAANRAKVTQVIVSEVKESLAEGTTRQVDPNGFIQLASPALNG